MKITTPALDHVSFEAWLAQFRADLEWQCEQFWCPSLGYWRIEL